MTVLETLAVALAGGSIGSVLTMLSGVPEQVRHNNRVASEIDEDLGQWVSDECVRLERALQANETTAASEGRQNDGSHLRAIAHLKEECLHRYRDQLVAAERRRKALDDGEGMRHRLWRRVARCGRLPGLQSPAVAEPILAGWRANVLIEGVGGAPVSDPTRRPLDPWAVFKYGGTVPGNTRPLP